MLEDEPALRFRGIFPRPAQPPHSVQPSLPICRPAQYLFGVSGSQCSSVGCWQELTPLNNALTQERKLSRTLDSFGTSPTSVASQFIPLHSRQSSGAYLDACCAIRPAKEADSEPCWPFCASFNSCAYAVVLDVHGSRSQHGFQRPREHS